jgi:hypothetical protein
MVWEPFNHLAPVPSCIPKNPLKRHFHRIQPKDDAAMKWFIQAKILADIKRRQPGPPGFAGSLIKSWGSLSTGIKYLAGSCLPLFKDPIALMSADWIAREYDANVVMLVRHPAAHVASVKRLKWRAPVEDFTSQPDLLSWLPSDLSAELLARAARRPEPDAGVFDLEDTVLCWKVFHETIFRYSREHPDWLVVRHEDLATNYLDGFRTLYGNLGLNWGQQQAQMVETHCARTNQLVRGTVKHELRQDSKKVVRAWMQELDRFELEAIRSLSSPVWHKYYAPASWGGDFSSGRIGAG